MNSSGLKIGYSPYHPEYATPGDRRRFVFYAKQRNMAFAPADSAKQFDVVYLTSNCNCSEWIAYKKKHPCTKIIFELIDSYLLEDLNMSNAFRGIARFAKGKESHLYLDYRKAFLKMIQSADAVVCSTPIQKEFILQYNKNVHISLDYFSDDIDHHKSDYSVSSKLKMVWEGQAYTVHNLLVANEAFEELRDEVELHVVTDPVIKMPLKILDKPTSKVLGQLKCNFIIHKWEKASFSRLIAGADLALIPIRNDDKLMWNKPENKLLLLWEIGTPVLTSPTPAYERVMSQAGIDGLCNSTEQWVEKIRKFKMNSVEDRRKTAELSANYLQQQHSKDEILKNWDAIFASVLHPAEKQVV